MTPAKVCIAAETVLNAALNTHDIKTPVIVDESGFSDNLRHFLQFKELFHKKN